MELIREIELKVNPSPVSLFNNRNEGTRLAPEAFKAWSKPATNMSSKQTEEIGLLVRIPARHGLNLFFTAWQYSAFTMLRILLITTSRCR